MKKKQPEQTLDMFEEAIRDKKKEYAQSRARIEESIASTEEVNPYDPNDAVESRNERNFLESKLESLRKEHERTIASLTVEKKQK